ncbi:MAG: sugar phosphate isomerase/epimerase [Verrucomicrobiota bacterium]
MKATRREFIRRSALAVAGYGLAQPWAARAAASGISLGFSLYGMKSLPLDEALRACAAIGYRNVELTLTPGFPSEPKQLSATARQALRQQLQSLSLELSGLMFNLKLVVDDAAHAKNLEEIKVAAELAHDLAPDRATVVETVLGGKPSEWDAVKERMVERLQSWAEVAKRGKIILGVKAHVGSAVHLPERLLWLLDRVPGDAVAAVFDYSHFELQGVGLPESLKLLLPRTKFIHVKDATGDAKKFQFLLPGDGKTDYVAYFKLLQQHGYQGPVVAEVSGQIFSRPGYDPLAAARQCHAKLAAALNGV